MEFAWPRFAFATEIWPNKLRFATTLTILICFWLSTKSVQCFYHCRFAPLRGFPPAVSYRPTFFSCICTWFLVRQRLLRFRVLPVRLVLSRRKILATKTFGPPSPSSPNRPTARGAILCQGRIQNFNMTALSCCCWSTVSDTYMPESPPRNTPIGDWGMLVDSSKSIEPKVLFHGSDYLRHRSYYSY